MIAATQLPTAATPARRNFLAMYLTEIRLEFLKLLRVPIFSISVIGFPVKFYVLFVSILTTRAAQGILSVLYMVGTFSAVGVLSAPMFGSGPGVASARRHGWMPL